VGGVLGGHVGLWVGVLGFFGMLAG
jgi:hypothetical protein